MEELTSLKSVGDTVGLRLEYRLNETAVNGVVTAVDASQGCVLYRIDWEDGQYSNEWWDSTELSEPHARS